MKIAIVTGASKGIGKAIAVRLKNEGYNVIAISRTKSEVGDIIYETDVTDKENDFRIVKEIVNKFGRIDVLVNNAGFGIYGSFLDTSIDEEDYMIKTLFNAPLYFIKAVYPIMVRQREGNIINIISEAAYVATPKLIVYSAAKAALAHFTNALWAEARKYNVKVSGIYPGPVKTNFTSHPSFKNSEDKFSKYAVEPEKVANAVIKAIKSGKREIYVPSKLKIEPYFLKLSMIMQDFTYWIVSKYFS
ncbi:SDR family oxidoreductase [Sulfurisphaera javensis]|uniref:SDR family oxidoreductase n=1 Tax=Sulfurisphaera javensis TaxID=2049879 RepID=A0AAT9GTJ7_9CREN